MVAGNSSDPAVGAITWLALASVEGGTDARTHLALQANVPVYLLDGTTRLDAGGDLWGLLLAPINIDQLGATGVDATVWTGSDEFGAGWAGEMVGGPVTAMYGSSSSDAFWSTLSHGAIDGHRRLYAFSELQTVPEATVPETASLVVRAALAGCVVVYRVRRRQR